MKRLWATILLVIMGTALSVSADTGMEKQFLTAINESRVSAGLEPVQVSGFLATHALSHSSKMAETGQVYHSELPALGTAENVGQGPDVTTLHIAFMGASAQKANILGDFNLVGIGVTVGDDGYIYVTQVFQKTVPATTTTTTVPATTTTVAATSTTVEATAVVVSASTPQVAESNYLWPFRFRSPWCPW